MIGRDAWLFWNCPDSCHDLSWPATVGWSGALEAMMHHAMPRGCPPAELYEHNLDPTCNECMHIDPARIGIFRSDILSVPVWIMRLLHYNNDGELSLTQFFDDILWYAILSHTWGVEEVTFKDITERNGASKTGFDKIRFCGEQARRNCLQYFWIDIYYIDKLSSTELTEAINSMFCWYQNTVKYYIYLSDVSTKKQKADDSSTEYT